MSAHAKALERIRRAKLGIQDDSENVSGSEDDSEDMYEEVTEQEYQSRRKQREDDFVVDDENGTSEYVDRGQNEWERNSDEETSSSEEEKDKKKTKEMRKAEREAKKLKKKEVEKKKKSVMSMFANQKPGTSSKKLDAKITKEDEDLMGKFLMEATGDADISLDSVPSKKPKASKLSKRAMESPTDSLPAKEPRRSLSSLLSKQRAAKTSAKPSSAKDKSEISGNTSQIGSFDDAGDDDYGFTMDDEPPAAPQTKEISIKNESTVSSPTKPNVTFDSSIDDSLAVTSLDKSTSEFDLLAEEKHEELDADDMDYGDFLDINEIDSVEKVLELSQTRSASKKSTPSSPAPEESKVVKTEHLITPKKPSIPTPGSFAELHINMEVDQVKDEVIVNDRLSLQGFTSEDCLRVEDYEPVLDMWWLDAAEVGDKVYVFGKIPVPNEDESAPTVYTSACVIVENIERNIYFLPRHVTVESETEKVLEPKFTTKDVYSEFNSMRGQYGINSFESSSVKRKYCLGKLDDVPDEPELLKVMYPFSSLALPHDLSGRTFSHVFNSSRRPLEMLLLKRKMMGPGWLRIRGLSPVSDATSMVSHCSTEFVCTDPKTISVLSDAEILESKLQEPPLVVMGLTLKSIMNKETSTNEVSTASALVYNRHRIDSDESVLKGGANVERPQQFSVVRPLTGASFPRRLPDVCRRRKCAVVAKPSERELLIYLADQINRFDPDVIVGHNFLGFDLDILLSRMRHYKIKTASVMGRLKRPVSSMFGMGSTNYEGRRMNPNVGRLICDTYVSARDAVHTKDFSLTTLAQSELGIRRQEVDSESMRLAFLDAEKLVSIVESCSMDSWIILALTFKLQFLPLSQQLTKLAGNLWSRTLAGGKANRNDHLLMHEFHSHKYLIPDKVFEESSYSKSSKTGNKKQSKGDKTDGGDNDLGDDEQQQQQQKKTTGRTRGKPQYSGGLVLEPKSGFYDDYICLLDFNSLYPSIIQEFNICFTTVDVRTYYRVQRQKLEKEGAEDPDYLPELPDQDLPQGILPSVLQTLVRRRQEVKKLMADSSLTPDKKTNLNIRQMALKLTANAMYGCLGYAQSLFYAHPLAKLVTHMGREILQSTVDLAESQSLEVIYGDTDSIMINTHSKDLSVCKKVGQDFKKLANQRYKLLELDVDGFFQRMLLSTKKKYAALVAVELPDGTIKTHSEVKGLDLVRRDWCALTHDISQNILDELFGPSLDRDQMVSAIHANLATFAKDVRVSSVLATGGTLPTSGTGEDDEDISQADLSVRKKLPLGKFIIYKNLSRDPEAYASTSGLAHVAVALRMKKQGMSTHKDDTIPYVMVKRSQPALSEIPGIADDLEQHEISGKDNQPVPVHPDEAIKYHLELDSDWYLSNQILQPVIRLCGSLDGTDSHRIAECLGIKLRGGSGGGGSTNNTYNSASGFDSLYTLESQIPEAVRFADVHKFNLTCPICGNAYDSFECPIRVSGTPKAKTEEGEEKVVATSADLRVESALRCEKCAHDVGVGQLVNQLVQFIRREVRRFGECRMTCDEPGCGLSTRAVSVFVRRCPAPGCKGTMHQDYSDKALYTELIYLEQLFDSDMQFKKIAATGSTGLSTVVLGAGSDSKVHAKLAASGGDVVAQVLRGVTYADFVRHARVDDMRRAQNAVRQFLACSSRGVVDLGNIFRFALPHEQ